MDYDQVAGLERLTGRAYFTPSNGTSDIDLGDITMHKLDFGVDRKQAMRPRGGKLTLRREDTTGAKPVFTITGQEFATPVIPLMLLGTRNADNVQTSGTAATLTVTAALGRSFPIGAKNISNVVVTVSAVVKTLNVDYFLEAGFGRIRFPTVAAGIPSGASVLITFDKPVLTLEVYTAFNNLNAPGSLRVEEEDEYSPVSKQAWIFPCQLSADTGSDVKGDDFKTFTLRASITGAVTVEKRPLQIAS
jgi:hypothetical protein